MQQIFLLVRVVKQHFTTLLSAQKGVINTDVAEIFQQTASSSSNLQVCMSLASTLLLKCIYIEFSGNDSCASNLVSWYRSKSAYFKIRFVEVQCSLSLNL